MKLAALALIALFAVAAPASAQGIATATPNTAGKATKLHTELDATQPPLSGRIPRETVLSLDAGYRFDRRAVAARCTPEQGSADACPAKSAIGRALVTADYNGMDVPVPIRLFLAKPFEPGDVAGFIAVAEVFGSTYSATGRLQRIDSVLTVVLPTPGPDAAAFGVTLKSLTADLGAMRTVKKGRKGKRRKVRHSLLTNPTTCVGTWAASAAFTFSDGSTAAIETPITCRS